MGILGRIRELEKGLGAIVVVQEVEYHKEKVGVLNFEDEWCSDFRRVVDKPRITLPDVLRRKVAKDELRKIYNDSKCYQLIRKYLCEKVVWRVGLRDVERRREELDMKKEADEYSGLLEEERRLKKIPKKIVVNLEGRSYEFNDFDF